MKNEILANNWIELALESNNGNNISDSYYSATSVNEIYCMRHFNQEWRW